ncbi:MAG TPA: TIGR03118 family protein, partial [Chloroflexota bacterium]|nr:TIGR03118 family protein [Chloroflexota bacterium]
MTAFSFVSNSSVSKLGRGGGRRKGAPARKPPRNRLGIEALEVRSLLSVNVVQSNLVSDLPGVAQVQDPNLVNPWGISESSSSPFWISDNNAGVSTLYEVPGANSTPVSINPLVVSIPTPGDPTGASGTPTGTVFNIDGGATGGFTVSGVDKNGNPITASAAFLFDTEDGTLIGWNPAVNPVGFDPAKAGTYATIAVDNSGNNFTQPNPAKQTGAVYTGLTIAESATPGTPIFGSDPNTKTVLYAANFRSGKVEVYDTNFQPVSLPAGAFADPKLPKGYAPFNVQVLGDKVYVTYAKQDANKHNDVGGQGNGFIDVFNLDGTPGLPGGKERLVSRGPLDSPWGLALAPSSFGAISSDLLVGNTKSGLIDVFNPTTGKSLGKLNGAGGKPIHIDGLWALQVGNGGSGGDASSVYFTAGLDHKTHGLFGSLTPADPADVLTYHNDTSRTGANLNETTLTPQNVNASSFGKLFSYDLDGQVYAQPLVVSNLKIDGKVHNVLFVATENDSVYALDANNPTAGPRHNGVLWQTSFIDPAKGITPVPSQDVQNTGISPIYGITATPVIDLATKTIYVVSQEKEQPNNPGGPHYVQEFSALNILTGKARTVTVGNTTLEPDGSFINDTKLAVPGTGSGSADGVVKFNALRELPRLGLVLDMNVPGHPDGVVFTGDASDGDIDPYHGWLVGYDAKTLKLVTSFISTPNGDFGGIWQGGAAPSVLPNGNLLLGTGNGTFDAFTTTTPPGA